MTDESVLRLCRELTENLAAMPSMNAQRAALDLRGLLTLVEADGAWSRRLAVAGLAPARRGVAMHLELKANGLRWDGKKAVPHDTWRVEMRIHEKYPLVVPEVHFAAQDRLFNPHCISVDHIPRELPPELQVFLEEMHRRQTHVPCCWVRQGDWGCTTEYSLSLAVFTVSRVVVGDSWFGEAAALNPVARDAYLRLASEGRLPLGPPLPLPVEAAGAAHPEYDASMTDDDFEIQALPLGQETDHGSAGHTSA